MSTSLITNNSVVITWRQPVRPNGKLADDDPDRVGVKWWWEGWKVDISLTGIIEGYRLYFMHANFTDVKTVTFFQISFHTCFSFVFFIFRRILHSPHTNFTNKFVRSHIKNQGEGDSAKNGVSTDWPWWVNSIFFKMKIRLIFWNLFWGKKQTIKSHRSHSIFVCLTNKLTKTTKIYVDLTNLLEARVNCNNRTN